MSDSDATSVELDRLDAAWDDLVRGQSPLGLFDDAAEVMGFQQPGGGRQATLQPGREGVEHMVVQREGHPAVPEVGDDLQAGFQTVAAEAVGIVADAQHSRFVHPPHPTRA